MNLVHLLLKSARTFPDRPAVSVGTSVRWTYRELAHRAARLGHGLRRRHGLAPGDRVALMMKNATPCFEALFGLWHAGLAAVPVNAKLHPREFAHVIENSGARVCLVTPDLAEAVATAADEAGTGAVVLAGGSADYERLLGEEAGAPHAGDPGDLAWLFYTSGTTGRPKGAMLSHCNLLMATLSYFADIDNIAPADSMIHAAPLSHGSGIYALPHIARAANQVLPESGGFEPAEVFDLIRTWPGCSFFMAPTMITRLLASPALGDADLRNLKTIVYGGGPMYVEDMRRALQEIGPHFAQIFGQGEAPMTITALPRALHGDTGHPRYLERLASVGIARTDVEVVVADENDAPLPPGTVGEVLVRGDVVMAGYWRNPEASTAALRGGWLHTGDMGVMDEDGFLTLKDRSKDLIISGGSNIYPREVEEVLLRHDGVLEVSVVGRPHADWGEEVVAFVVRRPGSAASEAELDRLCLEHIARFKRPKAYRFVEALPKNNYGKVLKTELRRMLAAGPGSPDAA